MHNKLIKKFMSFSYGSVLGAVIAFLTTMVTTRVLTPVEFGKVSMFTLFVSLAMIIAVFGTDQSFVRFFYEEDEKKRGALLYNCLKVSFVILFPILLIIIFIRKELLIFLFSEYNTLLFLALVVAVIIQVLYRFGSLVIRMQQKGNLYSILEILNKSFVLFGVVLLYIIIGNTFEIIVFSTIFSFFLLVIFLIYTQKDYWNLSNLRVLNTHHSRFEIFTYGYPLVFNTAIMWVFEGLDKFAIRKWSDFNELGLFSAAIKIIGLLAIMKMSFTTFWTPVAYEHYQKNPLNTNFYSNVTRLVSLVMMLVAVLVIMLKDLIILLLGNDYTEASTMLSFLVFIPIMYTISETTVIGINFNKKVKWHVVIAIISCVVNFLGNWMLVPMYGGLGASISTGLSYILFFTLRTFISLHYYKVDYGLWKIYISIFMLLIYASYTILPIQPIHDQFVGLIVIVIIILTYLSDILRLNKLRKEVL